MYINVCQVKNINILCIFIYFHFLEGWKVGRVEEWKSGSWNVGMLEEWKSGRVEGWKVGRVEG